MKVGYLVEWQDNENQAVPFLLTSKAALIKYLDQVITESGFHFLTDPYDAQEFFSINIQPTPLVDEEFNVEQEKDVADESP